VLTGHTLEGRPRVVASPLVLVGAVKSGESSATMGLPAWDASLAVEPPVPGDHGVIQRETTLNTYLLTAVHTWCFPIPLAVRSLNRNTKGKK